ncbi:HAMP domain-containing histidine kinase [Shewanella sp. 202IG2-18]|uniref:HAMP domain-containing histidine kinase n=1 Tax=Parashewanella hymeniacidonis TaxID=2807618 RepID=UPI00195FCB70|nr:HAMP domain-containing histidine kinase [Parashewanella hymeniacidonis]MBM7070575.1 HAMP domain-containing histidine kinase [Parashewanella hymeniacidonis]
MTVRYRIQNSKGKVIFCGLLPYEVTLIKDVASQSQKVGDVGIRAGVLRNDSFTVYGFSSNKDFLKSSQKFRTQLNVILNSTDSIDEIIDSANKSINKNTSRLIHNLTTINAHNIQEIYSLIPQDGVSLNMKKQISFAENIVKKEPKETAITLLRIAKNNASMKVEFSVFKKLFVTNPELQRRTHNIHKVLMNMFYLFFSDFTDKNVEVVVGDESTNMAYFDYESVHVALYHIIENAAKFIKTDSILNVDIGSNGIYTQISMDMISTEIKENEIEQIFFEGVSGNLPTKIGKAGDGLGMYMAKKIIELNSGLIAVTPYPRTLEETLGFKFQRNVFTINLPKSKSNHTKF